MPIVLLVRPGSKPKMNLVLNNSTDITIVLTHYDALEQWPLSTVRANILRFESSA